VNSAQNARHTGAVKLAEPLLARDRPDQLCINQIRFYIAFHRLLEIGDDLKKLTEIGIEGMETRVIHARQ
jgi:hypothetical protein